MKQSLCWATNAPRRKTRLKSRTSDYNTLTNRKVSGLGCFSVLPHPQGITDKREAPSRGVRGGSRREEGQGGGESVRRDSERFMVLSCLTLL